MDDLVRLAVNQMSGWDFLIALGIVLFDEYPIKTWIFKKNEKFKWLYKYLPIALGAVVYLVIALVTKNTWYIGLFHGAIVGFASMGCYDVILNRGKEGIKDGIETLNKEIEEEMKKK